MSGISMDTKLIILVLAATMQRSKFKAWINEIPRLQPFTAQFQQINAIRHHFGDDCRNFIMVLVLKTAKYAVTDSELQQLIALKNLDQEASLEAETFELSEQIFPCMFFKYTHSAQKVNTIT